MRRLVAGASVLLLSGCGAASIPVDPPPLSDPRIESVCAAVVADLPTWLGEQARREVDTNAADKNGTALSKLVYAWGDPAVILRCGVPEPDAFEPGAACTTIEGVDWFAEEAERGYVFTTVGRQARIEVSIPDDYRPESELLVELAAVINQNDPVTQPCV